jgi:hypothetical protein
VVVLEERSATGGVVLEEKTWLYIERQGDEMVGILGGREWAREKWREIKGGKRRAGENKRETFGGRNWAGPMALPSA